MKFLKIFAKIMAVLLGLALALGAFLFLWLPHAAFGFARDIPEAERQLRMQMVATAQNWLGTLEGSDGHEAIVNLYNSHEPLAQGYSVTYEDNWCAAFASTVAIKCGFTEIIPTECGCERQIGLFMDIGCWEESDHYLPLPGDYIYYAWDEYTPGDCTGWADHVGIVVGTLGPFIKVIEGNWKDSVSYHYILRGDINIRGYALPDYASICE